LKRSALTFTINELMHDYPSIEFPEYQREPTVWSLDQKQRLIDSILRSFDVASIYLYKREDEGWECIDGRQRLNAIMSFLGRNEHDPDNEFRLKIENEVFENSEDELRALNGKTFSELDVPDFKKYRDAILEYEVITVVLEGSREPSEFNLQFLRLNLGALINAGEKLHAMVGKTHDLLFGDDGLGNHAFLRSVKIPTRRYAREVTAAQMLLQVSSKAGANEFARARHFDLQRYLKTYAEDLDPHAAELENTLDALASEAASLGDKLASRALCVSVVLAAWDLGVRKTDALPTDFEAFVDHFLARLADQVKNLKSFTPDPRFPYLVTFQRHLTQAAVEKPAIRSRHEILLDQYAVWCETGMLTGEDADAPA
jgi:hypothetical protein